MESDVGDIAYPSVEQVIEVNRQMTTESGGSFFPPDNLLNRNSLEYILREISSPIQGESRFPTIKHKAAALAHRIIGGHVFRDGNKRTGIHSAWELLRANNVGLYLDESVIELAVGVASGEATEHDLFEWLHNHQ